jgi:ABC-type uncharacterized transport system involved in gliding motility auxiliary subunit
MQTAIIALLGLATLLIGWILMFILPGVSTFAWSILALGVALIAIAFVIDFRRVRGALISRRGKFGVSTTVTVSLFIGIVLFANAISVGNYYRFDFTGLAQFTLTSQTKDVLGKLDKPVEIVSFFTPDMPFTVSSYAKNLLAEYQNYTDLLTVSEIDPDLRPDQARQYGLDRFAALYGAVVFRSEEGQRQVFGPQIAAEAEHAFTSAILEVTGTRQKKVYFLTGHGEGGIHQDYESARSGLRDNLFQVGELDLVTTPGMPEDAAVLVIAGPQQPLLSSEFEIIKTYLKNNGRVLILLNPNPPQVLRQLLSEWWIDIEDGILIDPTSYVDPNKDNPLVPRTRNSFRLAETYFPGATAVIPKEEKPDDVELAALVWTSQEAWLEKDSVSGEEPVFNEQVDRKGPLAIGALVSTASAEASEEVKGTRLIVIGDSDFASNRHFQNGNNSDLFLTAVNWLAVGEEIISVDRKVLVTRRLLLSPEKARFLHISSIGLFPLLLLAAGGFVWWRRR